MKAHWPSGPASLTSLSHCPQYQERLIVLFLQYGLYLVYHVEVNAKTTTSGEQLLTHLLNEWGGGKKDFPKVFALLSASP